MSLAGKLQKELSEKINGLICVGSRETRTEKQLVVYLKKNVKIINREEIPKSFEGTTVIVKRIASPRPA